MTSLNFPLVLFSHNHELLVFFSEEIFPKAMTFSHTNTHHI